jgi:hypothetical protein
VLRERRTIGDNEHTWRDVRRVQKGKQRDLGLPGTKVVKKARETTAQKSSHQNMRFWMRRTSRAMVIVADMRKNAKVESGVHEGQQEQSMMGKRTTDT